MRFDEGVRIALEHVVASGVCLISEGPTEAGHVVSIAERISPVSHTYLYGKSFDVREDTNVGWNPKPIRE